MCWRFTCRQTVSKLKKQQYAHFGTFWCIFHKCSQLRAPLEIMFCWCAPVKQLFLCMSSGGPIPSLKSQVWLCCKRRLFFRWCLVTDRMRPLLNTTDAASAAPRGYWFTSFINSCRAAYNWNNTILAVGLWSRAAWFKSFSIDSVLNLPRSIYWFEPVFHCTSHEPWSLSSCLRQPNGHCLTEISAAPDRFKERRAQVPSYAKWS